MAEIDINFIPKARDYLRKFINAHKDSFFEDMKEYKPRKGYGTFPYSSYIVQCMADIALAFREELSDLSIPETFSSPAALINYAKEFVDHLESYDSYFKEAINKYTKVRNSFIPTPIQEINNNRKITIDAFKTFLTLSEQELNKEGLSSFSTPQTATEMIQIIFNKFYDVAKQIETRRKDKGKVRGTLIIKDEYDVQDMLHGLLKIYFDDIRTEEWTPSYAGGSKRCDFLLKNENIIIEVKKTRNKLKDKEIGEQLIIDIANYKKHPNCKTIICFVYDPDKYITNPRGIENDLKIIKDDFKVLVFIRP